MVVGAWTRPAVLPLAATLVLLGGDLASAQSTFPGADDLAAAIAEQTTQKWEGPMVAFPAPRPRPPSDLTLASSLEPLAVHGLGARDGDRIEQVLGALELAKLTLSRMGWPEPMPDGGRGGSSGFDLYFVDGAHPRTEGHVDTPVDWAPLDAATAFATLDRSVPPDELEACAIAAYAEGVLLGMDPAEAPALRRATATYLTFVVSGTFGCDREAAETQQAEPWRGYGTTAAGDGAGGALLLALLSARFDHGPGSFVRDLWSMTRQHTLRGTELRASPDLWDALERVLELHDVELEDEIATAAVDRFLGGDAWPGGYPTPASRPPSLDRFEWDQLPSHSRAADPALEPFGCAYALVDVRGASPGDQLRGWVDGEYGVRWSLAAVRLDAAGRELGRLLSPPRPKGAFLPIELTDDTAEVLLVGINLSSRLPDDDEPDENVRSLKLVADRVVRGAPP